MLAVAVFVLVLGTFVQAQEQGYAEEFNGMTTITYKLLDEEEVVTAISYVVEQMTKTAPDTLADILTEMVPNINDVTLDPNDDLKLPLVFNDEGHIHDDDNGDDRDDEANEDTVTPNQNTGDVRNVTVKDEFSSQEPKTHVTKIEQDGLKYIDKLKSLNVLLQQLKIREKLYNFNKENDEIKHGQDNMEHAAKINKDKFSMFLKEMLLKHPYLITTNEKPARYKKEGLQMNEDIFKHVTPEFQKIITEKQKVLKTLPIAATEEHTTVATVPKVNPMKLPAFFKPFTPEFQKIITDKPKVSKTILTVATEEHTTIAKVAKANPMKYSVLFKPFTPEFQKIITDEPKVVLHGVKHIFDTSQSRSAHETTERYKKTMVPLRSKPETKVTSVYTDKINEYTIVHNRDQEILQKESEEVVATRTPKTNIYTPLDRVYSEIMEANKKYTTETSTKRITTVDFDEMLNEKPDTRDAFNEKMIENENNLSIDTDEYYDNETIVEPSSSDTEDSREGQDVDAVLSELNEKEAIKQNIEAGQNRHNIKDYVNQEDYDNYIKDQNNNALKYRALKAMIHLGETDNLTRENKMDDKTDRNLEAFISTKYIINENKPTDYVKKEEDDNYVKNQEKTTIKYETIAPDYTLKPTTIVKSTEGFAVRIQPSIDYVTFEKLHQESSHSYKETTKRVPNLDPPQLLEYIKKLSQDYSANFVKKIGDNIDKESILRGDAATETITRSGESDVEYYSDDEDASTEHPLTGNIMGKCYVCGIDERGIPVGSQCHDAFDRDFFTTHFSRPPIHKQKFFKKHCLFLDIQHFTYNPASPKNLWGRWTGGCSVRWVDISPVYTQRTCRNRESPIRGRHFVSRRMAMLERALMDKDDGCIISPMATLVPLSRGISLFARFHACVCSGHWCNEASETLRPTPLVLLMSVITTGLNA